MTMSGINSGTVPAKIRIILTNNRLPLRSHCQKYNHKVRVVHPKKSL